MKERFLSDSCVSHKSVEVNPNFDALDNAQKTTFLQCYSRFGTTLPSDVMGYAIELRTYSRCLEPAMKVAKDMMDVSLVLDQIVIQRQPGLLMTGQPNVSLPAPVPQRPPPGLPTPTFQVPAIPNAATNQRPVLPQPMANQLLMLQRMQAALLANEQQCSTDSNSAPPKTTTNDLPTYVNRPAPGGKMMVPISSEALTQSTVPYQLHTIYTQPNQQQTIISVSDNENADARATMPQYSPVSSPCSCGGEEDDDQDSETDMNQPRNITEAIEQANRMEAEKRLQEFLSKCFKLRILFLLVCSIQGN